MLSPQPKASFPNLSTLDHGPNTEARRSQKGSEVKFPKKFSKIVELLSCDLSESAIRVGQRGVMDARDQPEAGQQNGFASAGIQGKILARSQDGQLICCANGDCVTCIDFKNQITVQAYAPGVIVGACFLPERNEIALQLEEGSAIFDMTTRTCKSTSASIDDALANGFDAGSGDEPGHGKVSKIFVGGLNPTTTDEELNAYFCRYGEVVSSKVMFCRDTGNSRRFGFAVFQSPQVAQKVCEIQSHELCGYKIETRLAIPRNKIKKPPAVENTKESSRLSRQVFVGGLPMDVTPPAFREWAEQTFPGRVVNAVLVVDRLTHTKSRGFGFVTFDSAEMVELASRIRMMPFADRFVEVKKAENMAVSQKGMMRLPTVGAGPIRGSGSPKEMSARGRGPGGQLGLGRGRAAMGDIPFGMAGAIDFEAYGGFSKEDPSLEDMMDELILDGANGFDAVAFNGLLPEQINPGGLPRAEFQGRQIPFQEGMPAQPVNGLNAVSGMRAPGVLPPPGMPPMPIPMPMMNIGITEDGRQQMAPMPPQMPMGQFAPPPQPQQMGAAGRQDEVTLTSTWSSVPV